MKLGFDDNTATVLYHTEATLVYFCCLFGAIIADSWWGKFKTIVVSFHFEILRESIVNLGFGGRNLIFLMKNYLFYRFCRVCM